MDKQLYTEIMDQYRLQREKNWRIEQARKDEVFSQHPDVEALCNARHQMILSSVRNAFQGVTVDPVAQMEEYNRTIRQLLTQYGYAADYLAPVYQCAKCQDTGLTGDRIKTECECFHKTYLQALSRKNDLEQEDKTFEAFQLERFPSTVIPELGMTQRQYMDTVRDICESYANTYPSGSLKNLILHGGSGLGKTYLLFCISNRQHQLGREALYVNAYQLLDDLRRDYFRPGTVDTAVYSEAKLLLIDDLGMEPLFENITVECFLHLINQRILKGLGTVISSNLNPDEIKARYTERFASRLFDVHASRILPFFGNDIRQIR